MEEKGQSFQPEGQEGVKSVRETGTQEEECREREGTGVQVWNTQVTAYKVQKYQSPSNLISNALTEVTSLYSSS